jgi:LacI family transcriptional regulator
MGVTIKDIAIKTGRSITTVSLVLNKKDSRISEKTRQIIESTAQELNYSPNQAAISLATKKTNTIALIIPEQSYYRPDDILLPFERVCRNSGYSLTFSIAEGDDDACIETIQAMLRRGVDGVVFDGSNLSEAFYETYRDMVLKSDIPVVSLARADGLPNAILPDHRAGAYLAVSHLLELEHSRIGCVLGSQDTCGTSEIIRGFTEALAEFNLDAGCMPVLFTSHSATSGYRELESLLQQGITGIFAGSAVIASGLFRRSYELGLVIPDKLSIVGYGNSTSATDFYIPLTSVSVHFDRIARKAVQLINQMGQTEKSLEPEYIHPSLIVRASTARVYRKSE